jgi:cobyrinic acid a,c-diamide synthase
MCGVIGADTQMTDRLTLGYRNAEAASPSLLADRGDRVRGHEFHRTAADPQHGPRPAWRWAHNGRLNGRLDGHVRRSVVASYLHLHWASRPRAAGRLAAASWRARNCPPVPASGVAS